MRRLTHLVAAMAIALAACGGGPSPETFGAELYDISCARCHGADLEGGIGGPLDAGSNAATNLSDDQLAGAIQVGPGAMPGFDRLTDEQVSSLVEYMRERQGE